MPINYKQKSIFVHIPKTGGTSIEYSMGIPMLSEKHFRSHRLQTIDNVKYALQHLPVKILKKDKVMSRHWDNFFKFSIVRNPYTRALSEFFWVKGKTKKGLEFNHNEFTNFLKTFYRERNKDHTLTQCDYLLDEDGKIGVDYVGRFEELRKSWNHINEIVKFQRPLTLKHKSSNKNKYIKELQPIHKKLIYKLFEEDFDVFKYKK